MSEEEVMPAVETAPEQEGTVTPGTEEAKEPEAPEVKTFTQEEFDKIVSREKAKARRQAEREFAEKAASKRNDVEVTPDNFASTEEYVEALAEKKAEELVRQRDQNKQAVTIETTFRDKEDDAREKYADYEKVAYTAPISDLMAEVIKASDIGPDLAYHLGKNPEEAERISALPPLLQAKEIGKLEVKIMNQPAEKVKASNAPAPIKPIGSHGKTDSSDPSKMSMEEYHAFRKKQNASWAR